MKNNLNTTAKNTWCPGCGNFAIWSSIKNVLSGLNEEGLPMENVVLVSGIGCHAKIADYINLNSFYSLHGRVTPVAEGIKLADSDKKLKVIGFAGDGDLYGEGLEHLIFAAKRNIDITMIVHNNRVYGLTTGQYTPTSPLGFKGRSTPKGTQESPLNPLALLLASGATFIARSCSNNVASLRKIFKDGIQHKGFAVIDVLQVCKTFYDLQDYYNEKVYEIEEQDLDDYSAALKKVREWDYNTDSKISIGTFYKKELHTFEDRFLRPPGKKIDRARKIREVLGYSS